MKILYDATPLLMRSAGVKNYHHALLRRLIPVISPHRLRLFPWLKTLRPNDNQRSNYPPIGTAGRLGTILASNYLGLPLAAFGVSGADLFHVTPFPWRLPRGMCLTSMVHDPTPALLPACHTPTNLKYFRHFTEKTLPRLRRVLTPSQAVKNDLVQHLNVPEEKISVVYHGVGEEFFDAPPTAKYLLRETYDLPDRYILFVGAMEPRKNLPTLIRAFTSLPKEVQRQHPLVIAGAGGWKNKEIQSLLARTPHVQVVSYVQPALMPALYHSAVLFVYPSLYEGFGMPLLEAMAACLPIVASNSSAIPEVVGEAALLVDPNSPHEIATAMERTLDTPRLAVAIGEAGRQRARRFTWEKTALQTKAFFEEALEG